MPSVFDVRALDAIVRIELDDSLAGDDRDRIRAQWTDTEVSDGAPDVVLRCGLRGEDGRLAAGATVGTRDAPSLASVLTAEVTRAGIGHLGGSALMFHAAGLAADDGRVFVLIGPSGMGKTTATGVLGRHLGYVSDETVAVRPDGSVIPYRKPLSVGAHPMPKEQVPASQAGLRGLPARPLRLGGLVLLDRRDDVAPARIEPVTLVDALRSIAPQTSQLAQLLEPLDTLLSAIARTGGVRRVVYTEAEDLVALIGELVTPEPPDPMRVEHIDTSAVVEPSHAPRSIRRARVADVVAVDDTVIVLIDRRLVVLDGIGPTVWLCADGVPLESLTAAVLAQLPDPPEGVDGASIVRDTVDQLMDQGLLESR